jgi:hypothetical protein
MGDLLLTTAGQRRTRAGSAPRDSKPTTLINRGGAHRECAATTRHGAVLGHPHHEHASWGGEHTSWGGLEEWPGQPGRPTPPTPCGLTVVVLLTTSTEPRPPMSSGNYRSVTGVRVDGLTKRYRRAPWCPPCEPVTGPQSAGEVAASGREGTRSLGSCCAAAGRVEGSRP